MYVLTSVHQEGCHFPLFGWGNCLLVMDIHLLRYIWSWFFLEAEVRLTFLSKALHNATAFWVKLEQQWQDAAFNLDLPFVYS